MNRRTATVLAAFALLPVVASTGCATKSEDVTYQIDEPLTSLAIDAQAASIDIAAGDGPVTVTEKLFYSNTKPATAHQVEGRTLRLTESGCASGGVRCNIEYQIRMPAATAAQITTQAGAVKVNGIAGDIQARTQAGSFEGRAISSATLDLQTSAGAASLEFVKAPTLARVTTNVGAVDLRVPGTTAYAVDVQTSVASSSVEVDRSPTSKHRIEVRTDVGAIKITKLP